MEPNDSQVMMHLKESKILAIDNVNAETQKQDTSAHFNLLVIRDG